MAKLKALEIWVPTFPFCVYHDDGFVDSVEDHIKKLRKKYPEIIDNERNYRATGMIATREGFRRHYYIFYINRSDILNINVRGHEETHFLEMHGLLHILSKKLLKEQGVKINLETILVDGDDTEGREIIAEIGGIYAVVKQGFDLNMLKRNSETYKYAKKLYNEAKIYT